MRIALIADVFPPLRSSGAVQLRDLSAEFFNQGHEVTVMVSSPELKADWQIETWNGVQIVRLKTPRTKDIGYIRRTLGELLMPFWMLRNLRKSPIGSVTWGGIVWYSPSIFLGPIASVLKKTSNCRSYLVVRDIFPEWAVDMGLMGSGLPYRCFKIIANYQYSVADVIGVQTGGNLVYFKKWLKRTGRRAEILQNWLDDGPIKGCSISISNTRLAGRKIFVYAGNMGIAQSMGILLDLADRLRDRADIGFLFVGRGSDSKRLRDEAAARSLGNVEFFEEIDPDEIPSLYSMCHIGLVALDPRHKTHNIPGKFLSYMLAGLPVLASINAGNDLTELVTQERVGRVCTNASVDTLAIAALGLVDDLEKDAMFGGRCKALASRLFSPSAAVRQIVNALRA